MGIRQEGKFNPNNYSNTQKMAVVNNYVRDPKHREVYKLRITQNKTYEELANEFGYSENHIGNILRECNGVVEKHIDEVLRPSDQFVIKIDENGYLKLVGFETV